MTPADSIAAVERRTYALRLTMAELCAAAGVKQSVWSRAKSRGTISPKLLARAESVLDSLEQQRAQSASKAA